MQTGFADLTFQEFAAQYLFTLPTHCFGTTKEGPQININQGISSDAPWIDWRKSGIVSPVKNQGKCGSSWAFSVTGALEAAYYRKHGTRISLSEQQILDCCYNYEGDCNSGCRGGHPLVAFDFVQEKGLVSDASYPYKGRLQSCSARNGPYMKGMHIFTTSQDQQHPEDSLKQAVETFGPVSIVMEVVNSFRFYKSGVYTTSDCGNPRKVNHAGLVVGYAIENGVPYWIIKNSWGEEWGDKGYFKIEMGKNMCGVASLGLYPVMR